MWYDYDDFCNLAARKDNLRNLEETFRYDELNRLTDISLNGVPTGHMAYDALGRMTDKRTDGQQVFASAQYETYDHAGRLKPHAMSGATMALRPFPTDSQNITYTMFDKVETISQSGNGPRMSLSYTYGHDRQRIHMEEKIGDYTLREKRYGDHCEIMTENRYTVSRTFLSGPLGVFAVVEHHGDGDELHYVYKDHLGSWTTITDGAGNVEREQSFDAWGNPRDAETWSGGYNGPLMFDRGFTGHEHLTSFGLINMNGRMYDPVMSTFLSPDNYIQSPDYSQSFNRYAYCMNNPLKYTDPSGWVMVGGMKPMPWSIPLQRPVHGPSTLTNAYNLVNLAFYGNLYGPDFAGGAGGSGCSGGAVSMSDYQGTYGYYAAYQANSVHNYTFPSAQLQLIRNWHNNPSHSTNSDVREAGITNVSVGTLHGQLDGKDGYRNSYYHWTDNSGKARFAAVCLEYVGGNSKGISVLSLQPLGWYGNERTASAPELQFNSSNLYIYDGHWKTAPMVHSMQGGQIVRVVVTNNNQLGVTLQLQDVSTFYYDGWFKRKKYSGECHTFQLFPYCSKSFDFYRWVEYPYSWQFELSTPISDAANVSVMFYSDWVSGMPPSRDRMYP
ncbi:MAG: RHS repeat-associated core domain-containing protein [Bacteroidales bacterium]|nr:RHS repeat-associated core domain-containing protein [Bacteroidales bacterium]